MKPCISFITLGVDDLERALSFYRDGLGWSTRGIIGAEHEHGAVVFFDCVGGLKLALWPRRSLAAESGAPLGETADAAPRMSLAQNLESPQAVRDLMQRAERAGARILSPARTTFYGGYAGYFQDPDGHLWEIAYNPGYQGLA